MPTVYTIPNRPTGGQPRAIADIIADFDSVLAALNSFDGGNIQANTISVTALTAGARKPAGAIPAGLNVSGDYSTPQVDSLTPYNSTKRQLAVGNANVTFPGATPTSNELSIAVSPVPTYVQCTQKGAFGFTACVWTWRVIDATHIGVTAFCASGTPAFTVVNFDWMGWF